IAQGESEYCGTIDGGLDCGKYILTYHKLFDGLINNCTAYDNGECSQCENGYQNNGTSCRDIRENTCDTYSGTTCTKCTTENLLVDNECVSKTSLHCQTSDGVSCMECESGNYLTNGKSCETLPNNCTSADGDGKCTGCIPRYYTTGGSCAKMPDFCENMSDNFKGCLTASGLEVYEYDDYYITNAIQPTTLFETAKENCQALGMRLPTLEEAEELSNKGYFVSCSTFWAENSNGEVYQFSTGCGNGKFDSSSSNYNLSSDKRHTQCVKDKN
ncbi:hypothetical protein IJ732_04130, partial [bacterium]|nr:hypothetical protein [bacterium]